MNTRLSVLGGYWEVSIHASPAFAGIKPLRQDQLMNEIQPRELPIFQFLPLCFQLHAFLLSNY